MTPATTRRSFGTHSLGHKNRPLNQYEGLPLQGGTFASSADTSRILLDSSLRELYRTLELPGQNPLRDLHDALDCAVAEAYGCANCDNYLEFILDLNRKVSSREASGEPVIGPGFPSRVYDRSAFVSEDCVQPNST